MSYDTEFGSEYAVEADLLQWFESNGFDDISWHNDICPSFGIEQPGTRGDLIMSVFVDALDPAERETGPETPRFSTHWYDENGDVAESFDFATFAEVTEHFHRVMEDAS